MSEEHAVDPAGSAISAWRPPEVEAAAYDGIREGDETAFRRIAQPLQPPLRRLVGLYVPSPPDAATAIVRTWTVALRTLNMFNWHTPFATWVARISVEYGRTQGVPASGRLAPPDVPRPSQPAPGPADWSDLPWSARWEHALPVLAATHADLTLAQREVLHVRDVESWPQRRACDVLGLPEATYERRLAEARGSLRDAIAPLVGADHDDPLRAVQAARTAAAVRVLWWPRGRRDEELDPRVIAVFRRWRAERATGWRIRRSWSVGAGADPVGRTASLGRG